MDHIVFYSGGIGSFGAAYRLKERGISNIRLLFTDTKTEDEDLYRFLKETVDFLDVELVNIADGRDVWEIFFAKKFLGNSRVDPCSKILKRDLAKKWVLKNYKPDECILYLGIDWTEEHRLERSKRYWEPYIVQGPLCEEPYIEKHTLFSVLEENGIKKPRLYDMGFAHNNCGGFCIKAGQAQFKRLLEVFPERYAYHEAKEKEIQAFLNKDVTILRKVSKGVKSRYSLEQLRLDVEASKPIDEQDWGGCGCMLEDNEETNQICGVEDV